MITVRYAQHTDIGNRTVNEDYAVSAEHGGAYLFALADGLGGHGMGDAASQLACATAVELFRESRAPEGAWLLPCFEACQKSLLARQHELNAPRALRTTLNLLLLSGSFAYWGHVGDSRTYLFQNDRLVSRTLDDSVPQALVSAGRLREEEIRFHEDRNRLLNALGMDNVSYSHACEESVPITDGQRFLLCTDGFWELLDEAQMLRFLNAAADPSEWLSLMFEALPRGRGGASRDNATAAAVWIDVTP